MVGNNSTMKMQLHQIGLGAQIGGNAIARYQAQYLAAAIEYLKLRDVSSIHRVYSEFHKDFVSGLTRAGPHLCSFFQQISFSSSSYCYDLDAQDEDSAPLLKARISKCTLVYHAGFLLTWQECGRRPHFQLLASPRTLRRRCAVGKVQVPIVPSGF